MIYDCRNDMHDALPVVLRYAMPNLNARYTADRMEATRWVGDYPECAVCRKTHGSFAVHHEPERSKGSLLLKTGMGQFVVKPALLLLCTGCHLGRTERRISIEWEFDNPGEQERFLSGWFFAHGYQEHDRRFFRHGRIVVKRGEEVVREIREEVRDGLPAIAELGEMADSVRLSAKLGERVWERIGWTGGCDG